jgi:hypothetical protein
MLAARIAAPRSCRRCCSPQARCLPVRQGRSSSSRTAAARRFLRYDRRSVSVRTRTGRDYSEDFPELAAIADVLAKHRSAGRPTGGASREAVGLLTPPRLLRRERGHQAPADRGSATTALFRRERVYSAGGWKADNASVSARTIKTPVLPVKNTTARPRQSARFRSDTSRRSAVSLPRRPKRHGVLAQIELAPSRADCSSRANAATVSSCPQGRRSRSQVRERDSSACAGRTAGRRSDQRLVCQAVLGRRLGLGQPVDHKAVCTQRFGVAAEWPVDAVEGHPQAVARHLLVEPQHLEIPLEIRVCAVEWVGDRDHRRAALT